MSDNLRGEGFEPKPVTNRESISGGHDADEAFRSHRQAVFDTRADDELRKHQERITRDKQAARAAKNRKNNKDVGANAAQSVSPDNSGSVESTIEPKTAEATQLDTHKPTEENFEAQRKEFLSIIQATGFLSDEEMARYKDYTLSELSNTAQSFLELANLGQDSENLPVAAQASEQKDQSNNQDVINPEPVSSESQAQKSNLPVIDLEPIPDSATDAKPKKTNEVVATGAPSLEHKPSNPTPEFTGRPKTPEELRADMLAARDLVPRGWEEVYDLKKSLEAKYGLLPTLGLGDKESNLEALKRLERLAARLPADFLIGRRFKLGKIGQPGNNGFLVIDMNLDDKEQLSKWLFDPELAPGEVDELNPETDDNREDPEFAMPTRPVATPDQPQQTTEAEPSTIDVEQQQLNQLRAQYVEAKKSLDKYNSLGLLRRHLKSDESKQRVTEAFESAKTEYFKARAEYVGANSMRYINEQRALVVSRAEEYGVLERNYIERAHDWWVKLGDMNLNTLYKNRTGKDIHNRALRFGAKAMNARALVSAGLLGVGLAGGATMAVGATALRRTWSGLGSGLGTRGLIESVRRGRNSKPYTAEAIANMTSVDAIEERLAALTAKLYFDGNKVDQLTQSDEYVFLEDRLRQLLDSEINPDDVDSAKQLFEQQFGATETLVAQKIAREKNARKASTVAGAAVGALVGGGAIAKAVNYFLGSDTPPTSGLAHKPGVIENASPKGAGSISEPNVDPDKNYNEFLKQAQEATKSAQQPNVGPNFETPGKSGMPSTGSTPEQQLDQELYQSKTWENPKAPKLDISDIKQTDVTEEILHRGKPSGATLEMHGSESIVHAGSRGLEGAILDLKHTEPEKYNAVMNWIKQQYPGTEAKDSTLVHRMMNKLAQDKGYTIDAGGKDLSHIQAGAIKINADGSFTLEDGSIKFSNIAQGVKEQVTPEQEDYIKVTKTAAEANAEAAEKLGPENIETEKLDFANLQPSRPNMWNLAPETAESLATTPESLAAQEASLNEVYKSVEKYKKASDALKLVLDKDYKRFMDKELMIGARELNKYQSFKVAEFNNFFTHDQISPAQKKEYHGLYNALQTLIDKSSPAQREIIKGQSIKQALVRLATLMQIEKK